MIFNLVSCGKNYFKWISQVKNRTIGRKYGYTIYFECKSNKIKRKTIVSGNSTDNIIKED